MKRKRPKEISNIDSSEKSMLTPCLQQFLLATLKCEFLTKNSNRNNPVVFHNRFKTWVKA